MTDKERGDIVSYRLETARNTLDQVEAVGNLGYWTLAANRLYYAAYYASSALLISCGIETTTHRGVMRMVNLQFIKTGHLPIEDGKLLGRLFSMRQSGDYEDWIEWSEEDVIPLLSRVKLYIDRVFSLISMDS